MTPGGDGTIAWTPVLFYAISVYLFLKEPAACSVSPQAPRDEP
jgi:hypothetical protein